MKRQYALTAWGGVWLIGVTLSGLSGCAHSLETRLVKAFLHDIETKDMQGLRQVTSSDFKTKALSAREPWAVLEQMEFPDGATKVVKVEDIKGDRNNEVKKVTVEVGKSKRRVVYRLTQEHASRKWVVDDVFLDPKYLEEDKSVATQVQLQLSVAELLDAWRIRDRNRILGTVTADFSQTLSELPPNRLEKLATNIVADIPEKTVPRALEIISDKATARLSLAGQASSLKGELVIQFHRQNDQWLAADMSVEARRGGEAISSVRHMAAAITSAIAFYSAYQTNDKRLLQRVAAPDFFDRTIRKADLSQLRLPRPSSGAKDFETRTDGSEAEVLVSGGQQFVRLSLVLGSGGTNASAGPLQYVVRELTLIDLKTNQDMRLSAVFNGQAVMQSYSDALRQRDLKAIRSHSTADFNRRVWDRVTPESLSVLPLDEIEDAQPRLEASVYRGTVTRLTVMQGQTPLTYVLRDVAGKTLVDDLEIPSADRQVTLKTRLELMIPIVEFAESFRNGSLDKLRAVASRTFSRLVWNQVKTVPRAGLSLDRFLAAPLSRTIHNQEKALVIFGDDVHGAKVFLQREGDQYLVDDVTLVSGPQESQRTHLQKALRARIARGDDIGLPTDESAARVGTDTPVDALALEATSEEPIQASR